jgi:hypothetical protein
MAGWDDTLTMEAGIAVAPPGWGRWTDNIRARLRARDIDEQLLNGGAPNRDPAVLVRRGKLIGRRYRSGLADALRRVVATARTGRGNKLASLPIRRRQVLASGSLILALADEIESEERVSPRGVILADRLIRDGDSPIYAPLPVSRRYDETIEHAVRHARAALHLG